MKLNFKDRRSAQSTRRYPKIFSRSLFHWGYEQGLRWGSQR